MPDIQDMVTKAIQGYANTITDSEESRLCILALAEQMAPYIIHDLDLVQEWAVGTFTRGQLDTIDHEDLDPDVVIDQLERLDFLDHQEAVHPKYRGIRRTLMTRLSTGWGEEDDPPLDEHLVELVQNEEQVACVTGNPADHNLEPNGLDTYGCKNCDYVSQPQ